jgi:PKD repeat protein
MSNRWGFGILLCGVSGILGACKDDQQSPPHRAEAPAEDTPEASNLAQIDLVYVCGNKFLATNSTRSPVTVGYRVVGTNESGSLTLPERPGGDPWFSETELETAKRGAVELYTDDERVVRRRNQGVPCGASAASFAIAGTSSAEAGQWAAPFSWPNVGVHLSLLPTGKVLSFGLSGIPHLWNPIDGTFTSAPSPAVVFCSGHSFLADGRLLASGGNSDPHVGADGIPDNTIFDPVTESWSRATPMRYARWYPTNTTLGNGDVLILAGRDENGFNVKEHELWSNGALRVLSTATLALPLYPRAFLTSDGRVFVAGESRPTRYLDPSGTGTWTSGPSRLYGVRDYGAAVMYDEGKILYVGGGRTTNTAEIIDLNAAAPAWQWTGSMVFRRRHLNATVLPTGEVLVTGGSSGTVFNDYKSPVRAAELWDPVTGLWTTLAGNAVSRVYHSTSLLLPDGRVLHAGSGDGGPDQRTAELFSPPYLFRGPRPSIVSAPTRLGYGTRFTLTTPEAGSIARVSLIRLGSVTHAFDMNQRFQWLSFTKQGDGLDIDLPASRNRTPPGHYLLFILSSDGVPSIGKIVQVGDGLVSEPPPPPPPPPPPSTSIVLGATGRSNATNQYMDLTWTGAAGDTVDIYLNGAFRRTNPNTGRTTISRSYTGAATYTLKVCERRSSVCSNDATVSFEGLPAPPIALRASGRSDATYQYLDLTWSGANGSSVDIYLNGRFRRTSSNTGRTTLRRAVTGSATYLLKVCESGSVVCSNLATVVFGAGSTPPNVAPVANFTPTCNDLSCAFADLSVDWDGSVSQWQWSLGDGSTSTLRHPTHVYRTGGTYTVRLAVRDNKGASGTTSKSLSVSAPPPPDQPPVANFTWSCTGLTCSFTDASTDEEGVTAWSWDFGDSVGISAETNPSYTYSSEGSFDVRLTVTDTKGATGTVTNTLAVSAIPTP